MRYLPLIFCLFTAGLRAQSVNENVLNVQIVNDSLQTFASSPEVIISLRCENNSRKSLLLYGFDSNMITIPADRLCANIERVGGGISVIIHSEKRERVYAVHTMPDSIAYKEMAEEKFAQLMKDADRRYLAGTKVLKRSITYIDKKLDLHEFPLARGTYYLQIIVFAGRSLMTKAVGEQQIETDKKLYNAELYQGCAISNEITFRVD
jgi:hypothetical protein